MKKIIFFALSYFLALIPALADETIEFTEEPNPAPESDEEIIIVKGRRMPPARIIGVIDFEAGTLTGTSEKLESIEQYEIWTEEDDACLFAGSTASEMTAALSGMGEGVYMLKLRGEGYVLIGFIKR